MKHVSWLILLLVFSLALAACGGDEPEVVVEEPAVVVEPTAVTEEETSSQPEPAVLPTANPTDVAEVESPPQQTTIAIDELEIAKLEELTSYRYDMVIEVAGKNADGTESTQTMLMNLAVSTDPPATSMTMTAEGTADMADVGTIEFTQIGDTSYIVMTDMGCMVLPAEGEGAISSEELTENFSPDDIMENLDNVTFVGKEKINGIDVLHYTYDETAMKAEDAVGIESAEGHIYVAEDGGYMVRSIMDIVGSSAFAADMGTEAFQSATTHIEMNLTDVNEDVVITPPAACEGQELPEAMNWPMLPDAADTISFGGMASYTTETSAEDAIAFYTEGMGEMGYSLDESGTLVTENSGFLNFINENDVTVMVTISQDPSSGLTSITIMADGDF
ncbi:MAG: hypothetical protein R6X34_09470 [Chloroflexota bacterium]